MFNPIDQKVILKQIELTGKTAGGVIMVKNIISLKK